MGNAAPLFLLGLAVMCHVTGSSGFFLHEGLDGLRMPEDAEAPSEDIYDLQRLDHFDGSNFNIWSQRYFVNKAYLRDGGPVFLVLGGNSAANPAWIVNSALTAYADHFGALLVLLEHRYYGKSQPVHDLTTPNLKYLSSRQALADVARFINYFRPAHRVPDDARLIVFGMDYGGSLAAWFRAKYPYMATGAVTSSARMVAVYDYQDFFVDVGETLSTQGASCSANIMDATARMYDWWGQADKRLMMEKFFKLCHKIDHGSVIDVTVFFYKLAHNFADVVLNNKINRTLPGGSTPTIQQVCDVMMDDDRGDTIQRYGDVNTLMLDAYKAPCLDIRYTTLEAQLRQTSWNSTAAQGGVRQWMYQLCAEFGWAKSSWNRKQPFGLWFTFPWNYTMDKCDSAFKFIKVDQNVQETNAYYGGDDITVSNVVFVNGGSDPWRTVGFTMPLNRSPEADIIVIPGASHLADMYPPAADDSQDLIKARTLIIKILAGWLTDEQ